jgi:hypothetical protein
LAAFLAASWSQRPKNAASMGELRAPARDRPQFRALSGELAGDRRGRSRHHEFYFTRVYSSGMSGSGLRRGGSWQTDSESRRAILSVLSRLARNIDA